MTAPLIWIILPGLAAVALYFARRWERPVIVAGAAFSLLLAWLAWKAPLSQVINIGPWALRISTTLVFLGRQFIIDNDTRPLLGLVYLLAAVWFSGARAARVGKLFVPAGLGIVALMIAALAVEPFLYAALLIEMAALLCVPLLARPGQPTGRGVLRFLTFQTLGTPFVLFTGWMMAGADVTPSDQLSVVRAGLLLALGFALLLAVFPFNTWIPMLAEEAHPYAAAFVFFMLPGIVSLFGLDFLSRYPWLQNNPAVFSFLRAAGLLMIVTGGLWAAFQRHLGRMLGYAVTADIGLSLLAFSLQAEIQATSGGLLTPIVVFSGLFATRGLALALWALALSILSEQVESIRFRFVQGLGRSLPLTTACLILAQFSLAGLPLLAAFPIRLFVWEVLGKLSPLAALLALLGSAGLLLGGLRTLAVMIMGPEETPWALLEKRSQIVLFSLGILALLFVRYLP